MVFNSIYFIVFFLVFFIVYWLVNNKLNTSLRNFFIVLSSYFFYGFWDWRFLGLIALSSSVDFVIGLLLRKNSSQLQRKLLLFLSVIVNIGILGFFKYFNFFIGSLNHLLELFPLQINISTLSIILPVGISFYTFQTLSYTIDVYNRKIEPTKDVLSFFAFVSFFPQLVAGPIERASHLLKQFREKKSFNYQLCIAGLRLVVWGFFKKIVIADNFGILSDFIFNSEQTIGGLSAIFGALFFALQIYADFSGYSDIAIGISKMLGFDLMTNFRTPYLAKSFTDFWKRWHISLSTWFRDYVYIPLGGNQHGAKRTAIHLFITFLISGLWHGANSTFLIWGALHGLVLLTEKRLISKPNKYLYSPFVILIVLLLWIPFRAGNLSQLTSLYGAIFNVSSYSLHEFMQLIHEFPVNRLIALTGATLLLFGIESQMKLIDFNQWISRKNKYTQIGLFYSLLFAILLVGNFTVKPSFIYFQF